MSSARPLPTAIEECFEKLDKCLLRNPDVAVLSYVNDARSNLQELIALIRADLYGTPGAEWRAAHQPDPHGLYYMRERAALAGGHLTDDQVANAVYMNPSIGNLTIAKERIRWLSRKLEGPSTKSLGLENKSDPQK